MNYELIFSDEYFSDVERLKSNIILIRKLDKLLDEIENHPTIGTGKPEQLKGFGERSVWSRRIDQKHRLIYEVFEDNKLIKIFSCYGHYDDK